MQFDISNKPTVEMTVAEALEMIKTLTIAVQAAMQYGSGQHTHPAIATQGEKNFPGTITLRVSLD